MTRILDSAASRLLDREIPEDYRDEWTAVVSAEKHKVEAGTKSALVFRIGAEWLSISTSVVTEIAEVPPVHRLPHRRGGILNGLVCVRGELFVSIALDVLLRVDKMPKEEQSDVRQSTAKLLICDRKGSRFAFPVDEVSGVHTYLPRDLKDVPATLAKAASKHTVGVFQLKNKIIGYLDDELLFQYLDKNIA